MLEKGQNINKKTIKSWINTDIESQRINILDQRFYKRKDKYYPSVTSILQYMPKGKFFETWLKDVGHNADIIAGKAAEEGTQTHNAIENYLAGEEISWLDETGNAKFSLEVWKMILKFTEFWTKYKPILISSEQHLFSDEYEYAGTSDLVVELDGKLWLLDIKTSNSLHTSYDLQLAAYVKAWNESNEKKIDNIGIIWLKSSKRGEDKSGKKIQGKGWELYESPRSIEENFDLFKSIYTIYKLENPSPEPILNSLPLKIKLEK